jgi:5-formyltetrahydrofolate cyclo-ligase
MLKNFLRSSYISLRLQLHEKDYQDRSIAIANACLKLPIWDFETYHIFMSIPEKREVDTTYLIPILQGKDKEIVIPKVVKNKSLSHYALEDDVILKKNKWGIPEPLAGREIPAKSIDVVFVPLLAFDEKGNRVGYGGGFYDRFLHSCRPETIRVGLSFFPPVTEITDVHPQDVPLHYCVTPERTYSF